MVKELQPKKKGRPAKKKITDKKELPTVEEALEAVPAPEEKPKVKTNITFVKYQAAMTAALEEYKKLGWVAYEFQDNIIEVSFPKLRVKMCHNMTADPSPDLSARRLRAAIDRQQIQATKEKISRFASLQTSVGRGFGEY